MERQQNDTDGNRRSVEPLASERYPVSFAIFAMARSHRALASQMLRSVGLFAGQEIMLMNLWDRDGQSQQSLGRAIGLDHSTVAKSVRRLEESGLVWRAKSPEDGRVTLVWLTDTGRALEPKVNDIWARLERLTTGGLTEKEQRQLVDLSYRLAASIDNASE
jgi:DNA-binding MarR family transcriptional regulator